MEKYTNMLGINVAWGVRVSDSTNESTVSNEAAHLATTEASHMHMTLGPKVCELTRHS